ncbi:MAG TPA: hypothetical protein VF042_13020, partial [Gemmatimonadaceae bacterium]
CSKTDSADASSSDSVQQATAVDTAAANAAVAQQPGTGNAAPVTVEDIDRWQRGMEAELKAVQDAGVKLKAARNSQDTLDAMIGANEMSTLEAGARAAGLDPERYKFVRTALSSAVGALSPIEMEMNTKDMPPSMVEEMNKSRAASLAQIATDVPAPVVEALRPRAAALRKQSMTLVGERLRSSGAVQ